MYTTPLNSAQWNGVSVFCCDKQSMHCLNIKLVLSCSCKPYHLTCTQTSNTADTDYVHNQSILRGKLGGKGRGGASNLSTSCSVKG